MEEDHGWKGWIEGEKLRNPGGSISLLNPAEITVVKFPGENPYIIIKKGGNMSLNKNK
jgi:hypothetical protein